jgi:transposase
MCRLDHLLRSIARFLDLDDLRRELAIYYSRLSRPSVDPGLMIRMLLIGYCFGIRLECRLCYAVPVATENFIRRGLRARMGYCDAG